MFKRFVMAAALATCAGTFAYAAEHATFILNNGERKSGEIVFHGSQGNNLIDGQLNLGNSGKEESIPADQVAVIDFTGGTPSQSELAQVPSSGNALVLRSGSVQTGTFDNIQNGNTVVWKNASGDTQRYNVNDVTRIYLNPQSARTAFNYTGPVGVAATSGQTAAAGANTVQVNANQAWTDTGITVRKGDRVSFQTSGQIGYATGSETTGPDGNGAVRSPNYPVRVAAVGALIGKVGNGAAFPIGSNAAPITMPADGRLMLGINDDNVGDNTGAFSVVITRTSTVRR